LEDRRSKDDEVSRQVWKEVENRKVDKTRMEEAAGKEREKRNEETDSRGRKNNSKNNGRKRGRRERLDRTESDRRNGSMKVP